MPFTVVLRVPVRVSVFKTPKTEAGCAIDLPVCPAPATVKMISTIKSADDVFLSSKSGFGRSYIFANRSFVICYRVFHRVQAIHLHIIGHSGTLKMD